MQVFPTKQRIKVAILAVVIAVVFTMGGLVQLVEESGSVGSGTSERWENSPSGAGAAAGAAMAGGGDLAPGSSPPPPPSPPPETCEHITRHEDECGYVHNACDPGDGYIDYLSVYFCDFGHLRPLAIALFLGWLLFLFIFLGVSADDYLCPALKVVSDAMRLSDNVAGVTLLALANGAPDISSAYVALQRESTANIAFGALSGAGLFVTTVVMAAVAFAGTFSVTRRPFLRDIVTYLVAAAWFFAMLANGKVHLWESIGFVALYGVYVVVVVLGRMVYVMHKRSRKTVLSSLLVVPTAAALGASLQQPLVEATAEAGDSATKSRMLHDEAERIAAGTQRPRDVKALMSSHNPHSVRYAAQLAEAGHHPVAPAPSKTKAAAAQSSDPSASLLVETFINAGGSDDDDEVEEGVWMAKSGSRSMLGSLIEAWREAGWLGRLVSLGSLTAHLLLRLTVPMVDDGEWSFWGCVVTPTTALVLAVVAFGGLPAMQATVGPVPLLVVVGCGGLVCSAVVFWAQRRHCGEPVARPFFAFLAFVAAVSWISIIANELVDLLAAFGTIVGISDAMLGISVLAWGNSLGDLVADYAVAKGGMGQMAVGAILASPLLNLLIGVGFSLTVTITRTGEPFHVSLNGSVATAVIGLMVSLASSALFIPLNRFTVVPKYGFYLVAVYVAAFTGAVVFEFE
ncbi:sodium/potassium/calcium exchanger 6 /K(+)/Ca(2+) [Thecamonas trahens ATCC 50062]|uniref:Sodium/potassium/calcium exchanger 6 /K(+)/Ca(2+) n=1 Tax=Thecamonas trahens ATCC 50062 TaxID=461836 RepID=A0A0L0DPR6_THETB|nr:sodium/potassium/calcium exchanger 6 /K(+)/Ca(2+) [Thecamonas trahens ATCC 50062]KNC53423.1 sodium/potassium/calcium exchanger 6 /K(+)/Ca(2+) [Thecamonas trahens ATCC 50062]|eukprot:XP_013754460.1 sodium/potassium/calcium exchanger 6 /K(+)/Ca(2+) [Thecamonas trahens ATCC 50062]